MRRYVLALAVLLAVGVVVLVMWMPTIRTDAEERSGSFPARAAGAAETELLSSLPKPWEARTPAAGFTSLPTPMPLEWHGGKGAISFVGLGEGGLAPPGSQWLFEGEDGATVLAVLDDGGRAWIPAGLWSVHSSNTERTLELFPDPVRVEENETSTVWIHVPWSLAIRVRDAESGNPVPDGIVRWFSNRSWAVHPPDFQPLWQRRPDIELLTDDGGRAYLNNLPLEVGRLVVLHPSYYPAQLPIDGSFQAYGERLEIPLVPVRVPGFALRLVVNDPRKSPASGVRVFHDVGSLPGESDDEGRYLLPGWIVADLPVSVELAGSGIFPGTLRLEEAADRTVLLPAESFVIVDVPADFPQSGFLLITAPGDRPGARSEGIRGDYDVSANIQPLVLYAAGRAQFRAPLGSGLDLLAVSRDGRAAAGKIFVDAEHVRARLETWRGDTLRMRLLDESGAAVALVGKECVEARYSHGQRVSLTSDAAGIVTVPAVDRLRSLDIESPRFAPVNLQRAVRRLDALPHTPDKGRINVVLRRAAPVILHVVTSDGRPLSGVFVSLGHTGFATPPIDSTHWTFGPPIYSATTGIDGRARIPCVPRGDWLVEARLHPARRPSGLKHALEGCGLEHIWVEGDDATEVEVVVDELRRVMVTTFDGSNGQPLTGFQVTSHDACPGSFVRLNGNVWMDWIPIAWSSVSVTAPGYGSAEVPLDERSSYRVELWPGDRGHLKVDGEPAKLAGREVRVRLFQGAHKIEVWSGNVVLDSELEAVFHVPVQDGVFVSLDEVETPSGKLRFLPSEALWMEGAIVEFTAVEDIAAQH